jgi:hypothetical protein
MQKQRVSGDYLQTSAVFDAHFQVHSAVNDPNDYQGPGSGYRLTGDARSAIVNIPQAIDPRNVSEFAARRHVRMVLNERGAATQGTGREVVVALGPAFGTVLTETINGLSHDQVLEAVLKGIREEGVSARVIKVYETSDCAFIGYRAAQLSGSGVAIGIQSKGTTVIHRNDLAPLDNLELFSQASTLTLDAYHMIGKNAAAHAKGESPSPVPKTVDNMARLKHIVKTTLMHRAETALVAPDKAPVRLDVIVP